MKVLGMQCFYFVISKAQGQRKKQTENGAYKRGLYMNENLTYANYVYTGISNMYEVTCANL